MMDIIKQGLRVIFGQTSMIAPSNDVILHSLFRIFIALLEVEYNIYSLNYFFCQLHLHII